MKGQSPSNIDWEKEKTTLNKMIQHAVIGDYSKKAAELVFKAEYGNTPEEQAKAIQANLGRFPSQIQKEDYAFIDQNFVRASNMIQSPNLETFTEKLFQKGAILQKI